MLNHKDMKIIENLRQDSRQSMVNISKKTHIPVSTVYEKIKQYEDTIIKKYAAILDFPALGYNIRVQFMLKKNDKVKEFLLRHPNVNSVFQLNGKFDLNADCIFRYMSQLKQLIDQLGKLNAKYDVHYVTRELRRECFLNSQKEDEKNGKKILE